MTDGVQTLGTGTSVVRPRVSPSDVTSGFWEAAAEGRLDIQCCEGCGHLNHPPLTVCPLCHGTAFLWRTVSGRGQVTARTVLMRQAVVGFEDAVPYACLLVELVEQPGLILLANEACGLEVELVPGTEVRAVFEPYGSETSMAIPQFEPYER